MIGAQAHRWTYAVFVCALLSGAGNNGSDRTEEHAAQLLERFVPPSVLDWLAEDPTLMRELLAFLSDADSVQGGAIAELVFRATEFGSRDLLPRSRGHPAAQEFSLRKTPQDTKADAGAATITANQSTLPNEHPEYLEDVEEDDQAADRTVPRPETLVEQVPEAARRFIGWLQQGLSDGALPVNQAGALVHFVDEGMLLVSPRIFREFAKHCGRGFVAIPDNAPGEPDIGKSIQRQVLRAGWHLRADKGVNILTYQVMRRNRPASRLSGVVFPNPERFVDPVPPVNPLLVRLREERGDT
ncbi:MAG: DNA-binding domain-containing protein [Candidatus Hydrogenedentes bacterium]|nr:DNA-binding domain-containing protein [Candidatus Hydrogenedentota bacterium]